MKRTKTVKRAAALLVAICASLAFTACGKSEDGGTAEPRFTLPNETETSSPVETVSDPVPAAPALGWYNLISDADEREIYDRVYGAVSHGDDSLTIDFNYYNDDSEAVKNVTLLCLRDHPEYIKYDRSVEFSFSYGEETGDGEMTITLGTNDYGDAEQARFDAALSEIVRGAEELDSVYERALYVHDEIAKNTVYDWDSADAPEGGGDRAAHSAYGCLVGGSAVCEGYAKAYTAALNALGIDCIYVPGEADGDSHAWNCVKLGEGYAFVDVTWDDVDREEDYGVSVRYDYFGLTTEEIGKDHTPDEGMPPLPECVSTEYDYFVRNGLVLDRYTREGAAELFNSGATSIKFTSKGELDAAKTDLFDERGCYTIDVFNNSEFVYSSDGLVLNVYFRS